MKWAINLAISIFIFLSLEQIGNYSLTVNILLATISLVVSPFMYQAIKFFIRIH